LCIVIGTVIIVVAVLAGVVVLDLVAYIAHAAIWRIEPSHFMGY
jgi:hypothetical protein